MFNFLKPRWKKEAKHLLKGSQKFIHYKRDLLKEDRIAEIQSRRDDLKNAIKLRNKEAVEEAGKQLRNTCEKALPRMPKQSWWEENVEVMFVALVIALGLRTYVLQPFRIPTGSMQPTLNGIIILDKEKDFEMPWIGERFIDYVWSGTRYRDIVADNQKKVIGVEDRSKFLLTRTEVRFDDGSRIVLPVAKAEVIRLVTSTVKNPATGEEGVEGKTYQPGDPILRGRIITGDLVLVNRISYHFRKPKRGEVFVFDTRGIQTQSERIRTYDNKVEAHLSDQTGGYHYIKRLCGLPGDVLEIDKPNLWINGKIADEPGIVRVMKREGEYAVQKDGVTTRSGYQLADASQKSVYVQGELYQPGDKFELKDSDKPGMREYAALGDNTDSSLDSRYWGAVHEFNLVGPGWFSLWPFGSGHWGFID